jgi:HSP20 family protein
MAQWMPEGWRDAFARLREDVQRALDRWQRRLARSRDYDGTRLPQVVDRGEEGASLSSFFFDDRPPIDVEERTDEVVVVAEMPGLNPKDFSIEVTDSRLILRGEKRQESETRERDYYYAERSFGSFRRMIALPCEVDAARASAKYKDGVLRVVLPKAAHARAREVKVAVK